MGETKDSLSWLPECGNPPRRIVAEVVEVVALHFYVRPAGLILQPKLLAGFTAASPQGDASAG